MMLALRDLRRNFQRFIASSLGVGLLLGIVLIQAGIYRGIVADALDLTSLLKTDMWVTQPDHFGPFTELSDMDPADRDFMARIAGVRSAEAVMVTQGLADIDGSMIRTDVVGYDIRRMPFPAELVAGRAPMRPRYEVAVDRTLGAILGERIMLRGRPFTVVGITSRAVGISGPPLTFMSMPDAIDYAVKQRPAEITRMRAAGRDPSVTPRISAVRLWLESWADPEHVRRQIETWKHLQVITAADQDANLIRSISRVSQTLLLFGIILVVAATAIVALTIYSLTTEKVREIATLKLIGAGNPVVTGLILWQAVAIGATGYLLGNLFLYAVGDAFPAYLDLRAADNLGIGAIALGACLTASIGAVRLALRIEPHQALAG
jgi:putative ABC transport system permease protein